MFNEKVLMTIAMLLFSTTSYATVKYEFLEAVTEQPKYGVLFVDDYTELDGEAVELDKLSNGQLSRSLAVLANDSPDKNYVTLYSISGFNKLVVVKQATKKEMNKVDLHNLGGKIAKIVGPKLNGNEFVIYSRSLTTSVEAPQAHLAFGFQLQNYRFDKYKSKKLSSDGTIVFLSNDANEAQLGYSSDLSHLAQGIYLTRNLSSEPGKTIYPQAFVDVVKKQFKGVKNIKIDVLTLRDMKKNNMGALLGVGQGSVHEPKLLVIEYFGVDKKQSPIALAGKGITFDTGGISLKQNSGMWAMKSDMAGAAAVAGTLYAAAKRKEQINLIGIMPLAENMPAADAIRPGDVLQTMKGTTIEILLTDAEGRLVLADAVYYVQQEFNPRMLVNIATLTGSAARALSDEYAVVITRDWDLSVRMMEIGENSGEAVWPLPLHPNHFKQIVSDIADIKNSGAGNPGASIGAAVIGSFVSEDLPWVHLDIAGVDWLTDATDTIPKGSSGWGVRFMDQLVRESK